MERDGDEKRKSATIDKKWICLLSQSKHIGKSQSDQTQVGFAKIIDIVIRPSAHEKPMKLCVRDLVSSD